MSNIESSLETVDIETGKRTVVLRETIHFEAPNWSHDGTYLIINSEGLLYRADLKTGQRELINTGFANRCNNDHGISPDGTRLVISNNTEVGPDRHESIIYTLPVSGGKPKRVTDNHPSYWHGWSPDGTTLAYVGLRDGQYDIYTIPVEGGEETRITDTPGLDDGPDYSPDGKYIYMNSYQSGHMQIWRMAPDGSNQEQLTDDAYSNWFPHPSPDGKYLVYLSYLEDQGQGHPFGKNVKLRLMDLDTGRIRDLTEVFFGGQGTINVPSWSPDSRHVAFVTYRLPDE